MRTGRTIAAMVVSVATTLVMMASPVVPSVALAEDYSYTIRVFAGNKGAVDGQEMVSLVRHKGDTFDLSSEVDVSVTDDAYYHKGFRESGQDEEFPYRSFSVDRDIDLVASYGMKTQMAKLTVHFREYQTEKPLATEDGQTEVTYEYRIGDKPVVAFKYIEGYRPLYRNLTGTITEDTDWYLDYVALRPGEVAERPSETVEERQVAEQSAIQTTTENVTDGGQTTGGRTDGNRVTGGDGTDTNNAGPMSADGENTQTTGEDESDKEGEDESEDEYPETQDIGDNDIPLADGISSKKTTEEEPSSGIIGWIQDHSMVVAVMSGAVLAVAMGLVIGIVSRRGRRNSTRQ